mgnify:FL=1
MDLTDIIYSNDYINILIQNYVAQSERYQMLFPESSALLTLNSQYSVLFLERSLLPENLFGEILFTGLPKLFTPLSTLSLEVSGIVQTQNLYGGGYTGKNVILGFLDTGIDYRHPAFLRSNGRAGFFPSGIRPTAQAHRRRSFPMAVSTKSLTLTMRFEAGILFLSFRSRIQTDTEHTSPESLAVLRMRPPAFSVLHRKPISLLLS